MNDHPWLNALQVYAQLHGESETMNRLQSAGVVSDLCVTVDDVAECDVDHAMKFLKQTTC